MEKKMKIIIGVVVVILAILIAGFLLLSNADTTIIGNDAQITMPSNYTLDEMGVATAGNTSVMFTPVIDGDKSSESEWYNALKSNGKDAGYENVTSSKVNGYTVYEYAGHPDKLKNVSTDHVTTGSTTTWKTFEPYFPFGSTADVDHYRMLSFTKGDKVNYLTFFTADPDTSLYTSEIDEIINSVGPVEQ